MFDDTDSNGQYRDRVYAYNMVISQLARKALGALCKEHVQSGDSQSVKHNALQGDDAAVSRHLPGQR